MCVTRLPFAGAGPIAYEAQVAAGARGLFGLRSQRFQYVRYTLRGCWSYVFRHIARMRDGSGWAPV
jgi:hypothetical protein